MEKCTNSNCGRPFQVTAIGGGVPGGKEKEEIRCPHCDHLVSSEMTSCSFLVSKLSPEKEAEWLANN